MTDPNEQIPLSKRPEPVEVHCDDLDVAIEQFSNGRGYRLDMIVPADNPTAAVVSKDGEAIRLVLSSSFSWPNAEEEPTKVGTQNEWITGRAGMEYRDLIPGRMGGRMIASHIRLTKGGEVPDYVHYHKVKFQMIYCLAGSIRVLYEDQGEPFWLNPGDCVLQPPEIRHRVLECTAGSEVVEIGMPAVHETWVEHEIELPTGELRPKRDFKGQRFVRHIAGDAGWKPSEVEGIESRDTGISAATNDLADVRVLRSGSGSVLPAKFAKKREIDFYFVLKGDVAMNSTDEPTRDFAKTDAFVMPTNKDLTLTMSAGSKILAVCI